MYLLNTYIPKIDSKKLINLIDLPVFCLHNHSSYNLFKHNQAKKSRLIFKLLVSITTVIGEIGSRTGFFRNSKIKIIFSCH